MKPITAERSDIKLRIGISGPSGFGKTYSALLLASGLADGLERVTLIDTENGSANLYAHLGPYKTLQLSRPFSPERYIEAIRACEEDGTEVIIIDSISHEWKGSGGCLDIYEGLGGRFQDWAKVTPRHQAFVDAILNSNSHVITTARTKVNYSMDRDTDGRTKVTKHGLKEITREGWEYELTLNLELVNGNHEATASKDRTGLFVNRPPFVVNESTGRKLRLWCSGKEQLEIAGIEIKRCGSLEELRKLYGRYGDFNGQLINAFKSRKEELKKSLATAQNGEENKMSD